MGVTARPGPGEDAPAGLDAAGQTGAAAHKHELITRLARRRIASGLSQADIARRMRTSQPAVARLESGQHDAQLSTLTRYAEALGLSLGLVEDTGTHAGSADAESCSEAANPPAQGQGSLGRPPHGASPQAHPPERSVPSVAAQMPSRPGPADRDLTPRQHDILAAIERFRQVHRYGPSVRDIARAVGLSPAAVQYHLTSLRKKGWLGGNAGQPRASVVLAPGQPFIEAIDPRQAAGGSRAANSQEAGKAHEPRGRARKGETPRTVGVQDMAYVPLVGEIAAGYPKDARQSIEDVFPLPKRLVGEGDLFLLKVVGDSMIDAAIADGDWVVVREEHVAENGEIVAAMIDGEATVKTYRMSDGHIWLIPHNPAFTPIQGDGATILGKVVSVLRRVR